MHIYIYHTQTHIICMYRILIKYFSVTNTQLTVDWSPSCYNSHTIVKISYNIIVLDYVEFP